LCPRMGYVGVALATKQRGARPEGGFLILPPWGGTQRRSAMALIDRYGGKSIRIGLIAKYVGKEPKKKG